MSQLRARHCLKRFLFQCPPPSYPLLHHPSPPYQISSSLSSLASWNRPTTNHGDGWPQVSATLRDSQFCQRTTPVGSQVVGGSAYYQWQTISNYSSYTRYSQNQGSGGRQLLKSTSADRARTSRTLAWTSLGVVFITVASYFIYHSKERKGPIKATPPLPREVKPISGKAAVGGPFRLINHEGKVVTDRDLVGNWTLIYFGYTSSPDICPDELQKLAEAVENIEARTNVKVVPVFVTIDPERDSVAQVQAYIREFHPRMVGLTGSVDNVRQVAREYRVYYKKIEEEGSDYLVDCSNIIYLMDPNMEFVKFFGKDYTADDLTDAVVQEIRKAQR